MIDKYESSDSSKRAMNKMMKHFAAAKMLINLPYKLYIKKKITYFASGNNTHDINYLINENNTLKTEYNELHTDYAELYDKYYELHRYHMQESTNANYNFESDLKMHADVYKLQNMQL